MSHTIAQDSR